MLTHCPCSPTAHAHPLPMLTLNMLGTVQTFRNAQSGPMLYAFVKYHADLGWKVIVYDRFALHQEYLKDLIGTQSGGGVDYHPYTVLQLVNPNKYNAAYSKAQGTDRKIFYKMEKNWGFKGKGAWCDVLWCDVLSYACVYS